MHCDQRNRSVAYGIVNISPTIEKVRYALANAPQKIKRTVDISILTALPVIKAFYRALFVLNAYEKVFGHFTALYREDAVCKHQYYKFLALNRPFKQPPHQWSNTRCEKRSSGDRPLHW
jgi:hypothetical protein